MNTAKKQELETVVPAVHMEFIQNQAGFDASAGPDAVEAYHRALFMHHHAVELERFLQEAKTHEDRVAQMEQELSSTRDKLRLVDKLVPIDLDGQPDVKPATPWNFWDRAMFAASCAGILALLIFGVLNISFNLLESGLVTFINNPLRAYFWAALLPVGALGVKIGWDILESAAKRKIYVWSCLVFGVLGALGWVAAYAAVYPSLSKGVAEHIQSLSVFDSSPSQNAIGVNAFGTKWVDAITVGAQAVAEIFISATLGIYMTMLYARHRPVRLANNPLFTQVDEERRLLEESIASERMALADARGNETRLKNQLEALVCFAKSIYEKEAAEKRDQTVRQRILLDEMTDQLRSKLSAFAENGNGLARKLPLAENAHAANGSRG